MSNTDTFKGSLSRILAIVGMIAVPVLFIPQQTIAAAQDYRFELAGPPTKSGKTTLIKVLLVHVPDGKPVAGAIIIETKFDMGPDGMASMVAPSKSIPSSDPGIYDVQTEPSQEGNWALSLAAKVQGESETVHGVVTVAVSK